MGITNGPSNSYIKIKNSYPLEFQVIQGIKSRTYCEIEDAETHGPSGTRVVSWRPRQSKRSPTVIDDSIHTIDPRGLSEDRLLKRFWR
jgi:hypothetical protein